MPDHRTRRLVILLALVGVALAPASADAYPNERDATPLVHELVAMAVPFWQSRGVQPCQPMRVLEASSLLDADGYDAAGRASSQAECTLWIAAGDVRAAQRERWRSTRGGDTVRGTLCTTVFHEVGHLGGLGHFGNGLMSAMGARMPYECERWVARQERTERRAFVARHSRR